MIPIVMVVLQVSWAFVGGLNAEEARADGEHRSAPAHVKARWSTPQRPRDLIVAYEGTDYGILEQQALSLGGSDHSPRRHSLYAGPQVCSAEYLAAAYATNVRGTWFEPNDSQMDLLVQAFRCHSDCQTEAHANVRASRDADRRDLGRVGAHQDMMHQWTVYAKLSKIVDVAYRRSVDNQMKDLMCFNHLVSSLGACVEFH